MRTEEYGFETTKKVKDMQIKRKIEQLRRLLAWAEENVKKAENDFLADLNTLIKETTCVNDLVETLMGC